MPLLCHGVEIKHAGFARRLGLVALVALVITVITLVVIKGGHKRVVTGLHGSIHYALPWILRHKQGSAQLLGLDLGCLPTTN